MLDILGKPCDSLMVRKALIPLVGKKIKIKYNLGRNKYEEFEATIVNVYNSVFLVNTGNIIKSFSFADIVTKIIKIYY
ncbi:MAG: Veg family protein [Bacilli bacterium]|nr:Veg family protein [Bacilli bacterium]